MLSDRGLSISSNSLFCSRAERITVSTDSLDSKIDLMKEFASVMARTDDEILLIFDISFSDDTMDAIEDFSRTVSSARVFKAASIERESVRERIAES